MWSCRAQTQLKEEFPHCLYHSWRAADLNSISQAVKGILRGCPQFHQHFMEEASHWTLAKLGSVITGVEVTEAIKQLCHGNLPGVSQGQTQHQRNKISLS